MGFNSNKKDCFQLKAVFFTLINEIDYSLIHLIVFSRFLDLTLIR